MAKTKPKYYALPAAAADPMDALRAILTQNTLNGPTPQWQTGAGGLIDQYARAANGQAPIDPMAAALSQAPAQGALPDPMPTAAAPAMDPRQAQMDALRASLYSVPPVPGIGAVPPPVAAPMPVPPPAPLPSTVAPSDGMMPAVPKPHTLPLWAKILAAVSTASGGQGAQAVNAYLQGADARDETRYKDRMGQWNAQQAHTQQGFENGQNTARTQGALVDRLAQLDPASQERYVQGLMASPANAAPYGFTSDTLRTQFYKGNKFQPVTSQSDAREAAATSRAQTSARTQLFSLTPDAQQTLHDSFADRPDDWQQLYGVPYQQFKPGQTQKDVTGTTNATTRAKAESDLAASRLSTAQTNFLRAALRMNPQQQAMLHQGTDPAEWEQKTGIPYAAFKPGMTERDTIALMSLRQREILAHEADATKRFAIKVNDANADATRAETATRDQNAHNDRQEGFDVTRRGQDMTAEARAAALKAHSTQFQTLMRYRINKETGGSGMYGLKPQEIATDRNKARAELQRLRAEAYKVTDDVYSLDPDKANRAKDIMAQTQQAQEDYNQLDAMWHSVVPKAPLIDPTTGGPAVGPNGQVAHPLAPLPVGGSVGGGAAIGGPGPLPGFAPAAHLVLPKGNRPTMAKPGAPAPPRAAKAQARQTPGRIPDYVPPSQWKNMTNEEFRAYYFKRLDPNAKIKPQPGGH